MRQGTKHLNLLSYPITGERIILLPRIGEEWVADPGRQQKSRKCPQAKLLANKQEKTIHKQEFGLKPGLNLLVPTMEPSQISSTTFGHLTIITGTVLIRVPW